MKPSDIKLKEQVHPLMLSFPECFESERLQIRAPQYGDGAAVHAAVYESAEELKPWMPWARELPTLEQSEITVREGRHQFLDRSDLRLLLFDKESGEFIGSSGLHRIDWKARRFEIGYWIRTSCSGRGYITEAVDRITTFAAEKLQANRIEIRCDARNVRSRRVAERLGFTQEALLRLESCDIDGKLRDTLVFAKVRGVEY
ncbi:GNAT family N-acetyltransferase [Paenibacillus sp. JX-17]|uniref:GNAT family N-acetyltransferase n=1 Tax=Paenibacillus lacisoli TaxID=3064525 RepID=A0ABT9CEI2_9BACL|nr:GNAT family N-acetyltransferase [Paenibacillus sp. JX-17]MDO7906968.1 GNAT family N-acetyltransferase [Paenibacillus sp. JX-17]